jgi:hypothetical protein
MTAAHLVARLKAAVMTADADELSELLADGAVVEAHLAEVDVHAAGREEAVAELGRLWRVPGTLVDWQERIFDGGAAITMERLDEEGAQRRLRLFVAASDGRAERVHAYEAQPLRTADAVPDEVRAQLRPGLIARRVKPASRWIGRATHDPGREALLARLALPDGVASTVVSVVGDGDDGWWLVERELPPAPERLSHSDARRVLRGAATLHGGFADEPDVALCSLRDRLALHAQATARAEHGGADLVPKQLETGWACFAEVVEPDVAGAIAAILDDPAPLAAATLAAAPPVLVHGDMCASHLALEDDGLVLARWALAAWAPAAVDLARFLLHDAWRIDAPREALIDDFAAVEGERHTEAALDLALLGGLATHGWLLGHSAVIHPDAAERAWAREELGWWCARARRGLARL